MRVTETLTLPDGHTTTVLNFVPECQNCRSPSMEELCSACHYLKHSGRYRKRMWGDNQGLVNRRWQMRFNRGELEDQRLADLPLWETKQKLQEW